AMEVRLTDQIELETTGSVGWRPGNAEISIVGRRWALDAVVEGGVYTAALNVDPDGNITGLAAQPSSPTIPISLVPWTPTELGPDMGSQDWAPNGSEACYTSFAGGDIRIADVLGNRRTILTGVTGAALGPLWSPTGTKILFYSGIDTGIETISPSGTGRQVIVRRTARYTIGAPSWSPTGSHIIHYRYTTWHVGPPAYYRYDVVRCTAAGGGASVLTGELPSPGGFPIAWR
ncbi:MAG: hypothetical protein H0W86_03365, partial [Armatimonadetes bacterium]|nr:hypothetical protein [Armatimonadota bacterium]